MTTVQIIIVIYMLGLLGLGLYLTRYIKTVEDFLLAGRRLGPWLCAATLAATHLGGGFILGSGEAGYTGGIGGIWYGMATGIGLLVLGLVAAKPLRQLALYTTGDYLAKRYNSKLLQVLAALLSMLAMTGILAAQVKAAEGIMAMLGFAPLAGAIAATAIFIVYTAASGMWGVVVTDFLQVSIALGGIIAAALLGLSRAGGFEAIKTATGPEFFQPLAPGGGTIMWIVLPTVLYTLVGQDLLQRLFSARTPKIAKISALAAGILLIVVALFPVVAGMAASVLLPGLENPRAAIPTLITELFPPVMAGIVLAAIMAAIMSTADSLLCAGVANLVNDLWRKGLGKPDSNLRLLSTIATLGMGAAALAVAIAAPSIIDALIYAYLMYTAGVFIPVMAGLFWARATTLGAITAMISGSAITLAGAVNLINIPLPLEVAGMLVSLIALVSVSLFLPQRNKKSIGV